VRRLTRHLFTLCSAASLALCAVGLMLPLLLVDHLGFLLQLCELELLERERRAAARRLKAARLPTPKGLD